MTVYKGFSTVGKKSPPYTETDIELVKIDLLNEFNTRLGERSMMPTYGSNIHDLIMDPLDAITKNMILEDVRRVIGNDPRVQQRGAAPVITEIDSGIRIEVELVFVPQDTAEHLLLEFERQIREAT